MQGVIEIGNLVNVCRRQRLTQILLCDKQKLLELLAFLPAAVLLDGRGVAAAAFYIISMPEAVRICVLCGPGRC